MKLSYTIFLLLLGTLYIPTHMNAQIKANERMMSFGPQPAIEITLPNADKDLIIDVWKHQLKSYGKVKRNKKAGEYYLENEKIDPIAGNNEINIYMIPEDGQAIVFIDMKKGFLKEDMPEYKDAVVFLKEFQIAVEKERLNQLIQAERKELKALNKKFKKLIKREKKLHGRIESAKETIRESKEELKENAKIQKEQTEKIQQQEKRIKELKNTLEKVGM